MSGYPMDPGQNPAYYGGNPAQPIMHPPAMYPPHTDPFLHPPPPHQQGPYQTPANYHQPFPQYGAPPGQQYYTQQQQQQKQGCCSSLTTMLAGLCAGMLCFMCLCDEGMAGGGGCCNEGFTEEDHTGASLMGFDE